MAYLSIVVTALIVLLAFGIGWLAGRNAGRGAPVSLDAVPPNPDPLTGPLSLLAEQVQRLQASQAADRAALDEQLRNLATANHELLTTTASLANTFTHTASRGQWGEVQLRRLVELSGMSRGVDFVEQVTVTGRDDGTIRPDLIIRLAQGRTVVVDAKVPLDALLAGSTGSHDHTRELHAKAVRQHIDQLASKKYWQQFDQSPSFVVMFLPAESLLGAALSHDSGLLERAFKSNVVIATPSTLLALLRTVALTWRDHALTSNVTELLATAQQLSERLNKLTDHMQRLGTNLGAASAAYNRMVGTYSQRVLVSARHLNEFDPTYEIAAAPKSVDIQIVQPIGEPSHISRDG